MEKREPSFSVPSAGLTAPFTESVPLDVLVLKRNPAGGQIAITDEIENWPGVVHATSELADLPSPRGEVAPEF
jgi:thioredoxin reductase (NADPH)